MMAFNDTQWTKSINGTLRYSLASFLCSLNICWDIWSCGSGLIGCNSWSNINRITSSVGPSSSSELLFISFDSEIDWLHFVSPPPTGGTARGVSTDGFAFEGAQLISIPPVNEWLDAGKSHAFGSTSSVKAGGCCNRNPVHRNEPLRADWIVSNWSLLLLLFLLGWCVLFGAHIFENSSIHSLIFWRSIDALGWLSNWGSGLLFGVGVSLRSSKSLS